MSDNKTVYDEYFGQIKKLVNFEITVETLNLNNDNDEIINLINNYKIEDVINYLKGKNINELKIKPKKTLINHDNFKRILKIVIPLKAYNNTTNEKIELISQSYDNIDQYIKEGNNILEKNVSENQTDLGVSNLLISKAEEEKLVKEAKEKEQKEAAAKKKTEEENQLSIPNVSSAQPKNCMDTEEEYSALEIKNSDNGSNACWINSILYCLIAHKQLIPFLLDNATNEALVNDPKKGYYNDRRKRKDTPEIVDKFLESYKKEEVEYDNKGEPIYKKGDIVEIKDNTPKYFDNDVYEEYTNTNKIKFRKGLEIANTTYEKINDNKTYEEIKEGHPLSETPRGYKTEKENEKVTNISKDIIERLVKLWKCYYNNENNKGFNNGDQLYKPFFDDFSNYRKLEKSQEYDIPNFGSFGDANTTVNILLNSFLTSKRNDKSIIKYVNYSYVEHNDDINSFCNSEKEYELISFAVSLANSSTKLSELTNIGHYYSFARNDKNMWRRFDATDKNTNLFSHNYIKKAIEKKALIGIYLRKDKINDFFNVEYDNIEKFSKDNLFKDLTTETNVETNVESKSTGSTNQYNPSSEKENMLKTQLDEIKNLNTIDEEEKKSLEKLYTMYYDKIKNSNYLVTLTNLLTVIINNLKK